MTVEVVAVAPLADSVAVAVIVSWKSSALSSGGVMLRVESRAN